MSCRLDSTAEWLEADGLGGFASGTAALVRTRRYHALLLAATKPPTGRFVLVNGVEAWIESPEGRYALSAQYYAPGVEHPDGAKQVESFEHSPWPRWQYRLANGVRVEFEVLSAHGQPATVLAWRLLDPLPGAVLAVRPLLSGRDPHALHHENGGFRFDAQVDGERVLWRPYAGVPGTAAWSNGSYEHAPEWYRNFLYAEERARGLDFTEDLASPGVFCFRLAPNDPAALVFAPAFEGSEAPNLPQRALETLHTVKLGERERRAAFPTDFERAGDAYLVKRGKGRTIVAGYPW
ncbi:MAG: glycogen debranching enzyme N-terminal domain-containing protein, partial [Planctomycetota bacterium]|nr:glycogen debranching enzyme N-terminal domain-containing protein [Planctomycetota bacterium]